MDQEKKEFGGWWMWVLLLLVISTVVFGALNYVGLIGKTVVERKVFENSFQYSEARKAEVATFEAQLAEINHRLSGNINADARNMLESQASALRIHLSVARSK